MFFVNKSTISRLVLATVVLLSISVGLADPVITNGSFETPVVGTGEGHYDIPTGWTHTGAVGDGLMWHTGPVCCGGTNSTTAPDGDQFVTLGGGFNAPGSSAWSQQINGLTIGQAYIISFMMAAEAYYDPTQTITVGFTSGSSTAAMTFTSPLTTSAFWQNWGSEQYTFTPSATSATLQFSVTDQAFDVGLDAVSIAASNPNVVPEPRGYAALLGLGVLGIAGVSKLRRRRHDTA